METPNNPVFAFLDGKSYTLDGVAGVFGYESYSARYPYPRRVERLNHRPSAQGKRSEAYLDVKRQLRDDWSTDLTEDIERYCSIAVELGYKH